ncbi:MAG: Lsm family RNA-binding protein [Candidatus Verstraetearchaeota archaeon]|nr:Lsm family RNA-binding protein [Candidatus Verstraetearchaeota archaeon]
MISSLATAGSSRFMRELAALLDKAIIVKTIQGRKFTGRLIGYDPNNLNLCLADAKDESGSGFARIFIKGNVISEIIRTEEPFDLKGLAERLEKAFPNMVKLHEEAGVIVVMDRIRVTEEGVIEGTGPTADRVKRIYEQFIKEKKSSES